MADGARSLNLATVVCAAVYEGLRQVSQAGETPRTTPGHLREPGS